MKNKLECGGAKREEGFEGGDAVYSAGARHAVFLFMSELNSEHHAAVHSV